MELRDRMRKKRKQKDQQGKDANKASMDLVANLCTEWTLNDSDEETDDHMATQFSILLQLNIGLI